MPEYYFYRGSRICGYCNGPWTMTHDCVQRQLVQAGLREEHSLAAAVQHEIERHERRQGRSARRRKLEILQAENESLIAIARALRQALVLVERAQGFVEATSIARRVLEATPAPEVIDARPDG